MMSAGPKGDKGDTGPKGDKGDTGPKGDTGAAGPAGLNWDDAHPTWDSTKQYAVSDAVYYQGSSYWASSVPTIGVAPDPQSSDPWQELAVQGS